MRKYIYLECVNKRNKKFYEIELEDRKVTLNFGRINRSGRTLKKVFYSQSEALIFFDMQVKAKMKKYIIAQPKFKQLTFNFLITLNN